MQLEKPKGLPRNMAINKSQKSSLPISNMHCVLYHDTAASEGQIN